MIPINVQHAFLNHLRSIAKYVTAMEKRFTLCNMHSTLQAHGMLCLIAETNSKPLSNKPLFYLALPC